MTKAAPVKRSGSNGPIRPSISIPSGEVLSVKPQFRIASELQPAIENSVSVSSRRVAKAEKS